MGRGTALPCPTGQRTLRAEKPVKARRIRRIFHRPPLRYGAFLAALPAFGGGRCVGRGTALPCPAGQRTLRAEKPVKARRIRRIFHRPPLRYGAFLAALPRLWRGTLWGCGATLPCPAGQGALRGGAPAVLVFPCGDIARKWEARPWGVRRARLGWRFGLGWAGCFAGRRGYGGLCPHPLKGPVP